MILLFKGTIQDVSLTFRVFFFLKITQKLIKRFCLAEAEDGLWDHGFIQHFLPNINSNAYCINSVHYIKLDFSQLYSLTLSPPKKNFSMDNSTSYHNIGRGCNDIFIKRDVVVHPTGL